MTVEQEQRFLYYFYEAERLWQQEQYADAFPLFEYCYALCPSDAIVNRYLGHIYRGCKLPSQALTHYRRAWETAPEECWKDYALMLYSMDDANMKLQAVQVLEQTTKTLTNDAELWNNLRDAYIGTKNYKKALTAQDHLDRIVGYDDYSAIVRYRIYLFLAKPKKAIQAIEDYLKLDPNNLQFMLYRMQLYEAVGMKPLRMIPIYQEILRLDPFNALVLNNYAYVLSTNNGDLKLAEKMSAKALQVDPDNPTYLDTYAWILYLNQQNELAKLYIRKAVSQYTTPQEIPLEIQQHYKVIYQQ